MPDRGQVRRDAVEAAGADFGEMWLGCWLYGLPLPRWAELVALDGAGWWALFKGLLGPFLLGAAVGIPALAGLSYVVVHALVRWWQTRRATPEP